MGIESGTLDQVMDVLIKNGINQETAHRKARSFVSWVKNRCNSSMHRTHFISNRLKIVITLFLFERYLTDTAVTLFGREEQSLKHQES